MPASANAALKAQANDEKRRDEVAAAIVCILNRYGGAAHRDLVYAELSHRRQPTTGSVGALIDSALGAYEADGRDAGGALFHRPLGKASHYWALLPKVQSQVSETAAAGDLRRFPRRG